MPAPSRAGRRDEQQGPRVRRDGVAWPLLPPGSVYGFWISNEASWRKRLVRDLVRHVEAHDVRSRRVGRERDRAQPRRPRRACRERVLPTACDRLAVLEDGEAGAQAGLAGGGRSPSRRGTVATTRIESEAANTLPKLSRRPHGAHLEGSKGVTGIARDRRSLRGSSFRPGNATSGLATSRRPPKSGTSTSSGGGRALRCVGQEAQLPSPGSDPPSGTTPRTPQREPSSAGGPRNSPTPCSPRSGRSRRRPGTASETRPRCRRRPPRGGENRARPAIERLPLRPAHDELGFGRKGEIGSRCSQHVECAGPAAQLGRQRHEVTVVAVPVADVGVE